MSNTRPVSGPPDFKRAATPQEVADLAEESDLRTRAWQALDHLGWDAEDDHTIRVAATLVAGSLAQPPARDVIEQAVRWAVAHPHAADWPAGTVVATATTVYIRDDGVPAGEPSLPWREATTASMYANLASDPEIDALIADGEATVLRIGTGAEPRAASRDRAEAWVLEDAVRDVVIPEAPDEPADGTWLIGDDTDGDGLSSVFRRDDAEGHNDPDRRHHRRWWDYARGEWIDWPTAVRRGADPARRLREEGPR